MKTLLKQTKQHNRSIIHLKLGLALEVFAAYIQIQKLIKRRLKTKNAMINNNYQMADTTTFKQQGYISQQEFLYSISIESDMLLSKIQFDEVPPESPQINYNTVEAKIKELTQTADPLPFKKSKPFCGCGQFYSCTSSLYLHIRSKHGGKPPFGTIGGPKGIVKKPPQPEPIVKVQEEPNIYTKFSQDNKTIIPNKTISTQISNEEAQKIAQSTMKPNAQVDESSKKKEQPKNKICKLCNKRYTCNSSLNLHLKRKHQIRKTWDGRTEISPLAEERVQKSFQCSMCELSYGSKSALGLHYNNKHSSKSQLDQEGPYDDNKIQKCGCGLVYQSRSALNMHVKKKHNGNYPQGTTEKPNLRQSGQYRDERYEINRIENYLVRNQSNSDEEQSIYDSESQEDKNQHKNESFPCNKRNEEEIQKPYKCGCGRTYSCSSSLNLHIKKNHNWVVPQGTIGGPRGMRYEEENKQAPKHIQQMGQNTYQCSQCKKKIDGSFFRCKMCDRHQMCSKCFWNGDMVSEEHQWEVIKYKNK